MPDDIAPTTPDDPAALGPYRLVGVLGAGGMGKVYLARRRSGPRPRPVAVKVLLPEVAHDEELVRRFAREAVAASAVRGARVARVVGHGTDGQPWIATEYLAGPSLAAHLGRHGPLPTAALRQLAAELAAALDDVHRAGLVHRDLKPANIVVTATGPRLIDFGIARPEYGMTLTTAGIPATPGYAAPEQLTGRRAGPAADVFALGAVLVIAGTGHPAFPATDVHWANYQVVHGEPELDGVPAELRSVIAACLAKEPGDRPAPRDLLGLADGVAAPGFWTVEPVAGDIAARARAARTAIRGGGRTGTATGPTRRRALGVAGAALVAAGGAAWWRGGPNDDAATGGLDSDAAPLTDYQPGLAPDPYWTREDLAEEGPAPLPAGDVVLAAAASGGLAAFGVVDGAPVWSDESALPASGMAAGGAGRTELVLVATANDEVRALRSTDGTTLWSSSVAVESILTADTETGLVLATDGTLTALDLRTGEERWRAATALAGERPGAALHEGTVLLATADRLAAYDAADGGVRWSRDGRFADTAGAPAVIDGRVVVGGESLLALEVGEGGEAWSLPGQGAEWRQPVAADDGVCAVHGWDLVRVTAADGEQLWSARLDVEDELPPEPPVWEGASVWTTLGGPGTKGVSTWLAHNGTSLWAVSDGRRGQWRLAGSGYRVFLLRAGQLMAMPVP
ncbi:protein kinase domain-containing protein [Streptomyces profundus]|uniref:serine/threonine-protein kinase n=1 Tax=Streptomyces profundus TaxID=2867410 RepID=UPI001D16C3CF|nr:serine/threonine-protein kinase [Streptomyces sp. MA3_2.13]UED87486.1 serine/threonine-protein kinase [Streptomyces sp. MA3_2.13]